MDLSFQSLVLVAVMPKPRDMEIARLLGWYRIPVKSAPKILQPDLIAFYQTASFPKDHRSMIECVAEVRGVEMTTRKELFRDEPDHIRANEEYYKIQLGSVEKLPHPIPADEWKRFTFFYTTGEHLASAESIRGLAMRSSERSQLWQALRERQAQYGSDPVQTDADGLEIPQDLLFLLGNLSLAGLDLGGNNP